MRVLELLGHSDNMNSSEYSPINVIVDKIDAVKNGHAKGVIVYGYMTGCPHCMRYDGVWSEACEDCPKGVFTYKVMMEDFPEDDSRIGTAPRSFPTIYSYTRSPDGTIIRKDHSHRRDEIRDIMEDIATKGSVAIEADEGEEERIEDDKPSLQVISMPSVEVKPKRKRATKKKKRSVKTRKRGRKTTAVRSKSTMRRRKKTPKRKSK